MYKHTQEAMSIIFITNIFKRTKEWASASHLIQRYFYFYDTVFIILVTDKHDIIIDLRHGRRPLLFNCSCSGIVIMVSSFFEYEF